MTRTGFEPPRGRRPMTVDWRSLGCDPEPFGMRFERLADPAQCTSLRPVSVRPHGDRPPGPASHRHRR